MSGSVFTQRYGSADFLTPPDIFVTKHFPDTPRWQLLTPPIARGEFNRRPILSPDFHAAAFTLLSPDRSQVDTGRGFHARVRGDGTHFLLAAYRPIGSAESGERCQVIPQGAELDIHCRLPGPGHYEVTLFVSSQRYGEYGSAGSVEAIYR